MALKKYLGKLLFSWSCVSSWIQEERSTGKRYPLMCNESHTWSGAFQTPSHLQIDSPPQLSSWYPCNLKGSVSSIHVLNGKCLDLYTYKIRINQCHSASYPVRETYPTLSTLLLSTKKSLRLLPMRERQNTTTSTEVGVRGVWAMSHAVTWGLAATRSREWTQLCGTRWANAASPHPISATIHSFGLPNSNNNNNKLLYYIGI